MLFALTETTFSAVVWTGDAPVEEASKVTFSPKEIVIVDPILEVISVVSLAAWAVNGNAINANTTRLATSDHEIVRSVRYSKDNASIFVLFSYFYIMG